MWISLLRSLLGPLLQLFGYGAVAGGATYAEHERAKAAAAKAAAEKEKKMRAAATSGPSGGNDVDDLLRDHKF